MTADRSLRIGVVLEAFLDGPLDRVMPWLREHAPDVTDQRQWEEQIAIDDAALEPA